MHMSFYMPTDIDEAQVYEIVLNLLTVGYGCEQRHREEAQIAY